MDALNIRQLNNSDYEDILVNWWKDWGWEVPARDFLPNSGLIVYDADIPVCAGFIYITNSSVAWVDWIISSKTYNTKPTRREAIKLLIFELTELCKKNGYKYTYALIKHPSLIEVYEGCGYVKGDNYTTEMIKLL